MLDQISKQTETMRKVIVVIIAVFISSTNLFADIHCENLNQSENSFLGMWGIDIEGGGIGWLNIHEKQGFLDGELLWVGGSVIPVSNIYLVDDHTLVVTRTDEKILKKDSLATERKHIRTWTLRITKTNDEITGTMSGPSWDGKGEQVNHFNGRRMPPVGPRPNLNTLTYGKAIKLFNGKDIDNWRPVNPKQPNGFEVINGTLRNDPVQPETGAHLYYGNLRTAQEFGDFNLKLEVNVPKGNNSGIYLRGLYEIQVMDSFGLDLDSHNMGALYSRITPSESAEKPGGEWQTLDITLVDRHVSVILNGKKIIDNKPVVGPTGGAISSDVFAPGPICLQGDHGNVAYRNIVLTPIL